MGLTASFTPSPLAQMANIWSVAVMMDESIAGRSQTKASLSRRPSLIIRRLSPRSQVVVARWRLVPMVKSWPVLVLIT